MKGGRWKGVGRYYERRKERREYEDIMEGGRRKESR